jgi:hypothetical protein
MHAPPNIATKNTNDRVRSGRSRVTPPHQDMYIIRKHMNNRYSRAIQTARQTIANHQIPIRDDIVRRRLIANYIRCRRLSRGPILTVRHRQERL